MCKHNEKQDKKTKAKPLTEGTVKKGGRNSKPNTPPPPPPSGQDGKRYKNERTKK